MIDIITLLQSTGVNIDLTAVITGIVSTFLIQGAKRVSVIPINEGQTKAIRTVAAILTFGGAFTTAWASGQLDSAQFTGYLGVVGQGLAAYFVAYLTYHSAVKNNQNNTPVELG